MQQRLPTAEVWTVETDQKNDQEKRCMVLPSRAVALILSGAGASYPVTDMKPVRDLVFS